MPFYIPNQGRMHKLQKQLVTKVIILHNLTQFIEILQFYKYVLKENY